MKTHLRIRERGGQTGIALEHAVVDVMPRRVGSERRVGAASRRNARSRRRARRRRERGRAARERQPGGGCPIHPARHHVYYCVLEGDPGLPAALADPEVSLMANSARSANGWGAAARRPVLDGVGGIRRERFHPEPLDAPTHRCACS